MKLYKLTLSALLLAAGVACTSDDDKDTTGTDSDTDETDTDVEVLECTTDDTFTYDNDGDEETATLGVDGLQIVVVEPNLAANGFQPFQSWTCDYTYGDNVLNIWQTGTTNGWDNEFVVPSTGYRQGDETTHRADALEKQLDHVDDIDDLVGDQTLFNTDDDGTLTYALRIYDATGALADCWVWGDDTAAVFAGTYPSNNTVSDSAELTANNCFTPTK